MKTGNFTDITAADPGRISLCKLAQVTPDIEFFRRTKNQVYPWYAGDLHGLELRIATGDHHHAFRRLALDLPDKMAAFPVRIVGHRTGVDDIHISQVVKRLFFKAFGFQQPGNRRSFGKIEFTTQSMKCHCAGFCHGVAKLGNTRDCLLSKPSIPIFTIMSKRGLPVIIVVVLALAVFLVKQAGCGPKARKKAATTTETKTTVNRNHGFDRRTSFLTYSKHAECRMLCRQISRPEVEEMMKEGKINYNKSDIKNARCPRYAVEGNTSDGQRVRIVFAQCDESTAVVTVIDLGKDHACDCPGDDDKYRNRK